MKPKDKKRARTTSATPGHGISLAEQKNGEPITKVQEGEDDVVMIANNEAMQAEAEQEARKRAREKRAAGIFEAWFTTGQEARDVAMLPVCDQPPPHMVKTKLLKHQLQALRWMVEMEHPKPRTFL